MALVSIIICQAIHFYFEEGSLSLGERSAGKKKARLTLSFRHLLDLDILQRFVLYPARELFLIEFSVNGSWGEDLVCHRFLSLDY